MAIYITNVVLTDLCVSQSRKMRAVSFHSLQDRVECTVVVCQINPVEGAFQLKNPESEGVVHSFLKEIAAAWGPPLTAYFPILSFIMSFDITE